MTNTQKARLTTCGIIPCTERKTTKMLKKQKAQLQDMDSGGILDFQIRLQIECGMTHQEAADYISQAF